MNPQTELSEAIAPMIHTSDSANIAFYRERGGATKGYVFCEVTRYDLLPPKGPDGLRNWKGWHPLPTFGVTVYRQGVGVIVQHYRYEPKTRPRPGRLPDRTVTQLVRRAIAEANKAQERG